jgi:hypothetical protein
LLDLSQEYFQGIGGVIGALLATTGELWVGSGCSAVSHGGDVGLKDGQAWHLSTTPGPSAFFV